LPSGAQHPERQSAFTVQIEAQLPPFVVTHVSPAQQSRVDVQATLGPAHVARQNPRGAHASMPVFTSGAQHPEAHSASVAHGAAQTDCASPVTGAEQMPEQHEFGVLVHTTPTARHEGTGVEASGSGTADNSGAESCSAPESLASGTWLASGAVASGTDATS
jgi:hypothetical protein